MVREFRGFVEGVIGKKLPSDSSLNNMKKRELIKLLHLAQENYETLLWFHSNSVRVSTERENAVARVLKRFEEEIAENSEVNLWEYRAGLYKAIKILKEEVN